MLPGFPAPLEAEDTAVVTAYLDDALERDGEMLVLRGNELTLLSPVAATTMALSRDGALTVAELTRALMAVFGAPDDGDSDVAVRQILRSLADRGLVKVESAS